MRVASRRQGTRAAQLEQMRQELLFLEQAACCGTDAYIIKIISYKDAVPQFAEVCPNCGRVRAGIIYIAQPAVARVQDEQSRRVQLAVA